MYQDTFASVKYTAAVISGVTQKPSFLLWPDLESNPQEELNVSCLKGHTSADFTEVHPDRTPLVGRQPLIGQRWCHHPKECVKGLSCSGDRGFVSFPCSDPLTSTLHSAVIFTYNRRAACSCQKVHVTGVYLTQFHNVITHYPGSTGNYGHTV